MSTIPSLSRENAFHFQNRAREARERTLQARAVESKELAQELEWKPAFETFKDLKHYKTTITDQDLFDKAKDKIDPSTVYRLENEFAHKKNVLVLTQKAMKANRRIGLLAPPPHMNPLNKAKSELESYREAFQQYRKHIIDNAPLWATFTQAHQPIRERLSDTALEKRHRMAKKAIEEPGLNTRNKPAYTKSLKTWLESIFKHVPKA